MKRFFVFLLLLVSSCSSLFAQNRGFKHPGGLHTQADFDRIKQQLADGDPTVTAAYQVLKDFKTLNPYQHPFSDPDEIKERYSESAELKIRTHLNLLTNLQRRLQYLELSQFVAPINNTSLVIPSKYILPPHPSPFFTSGKHK